MTLFKIYEVARNTPYGDLIMGRFILKRSALKLQKEWNDKINTSWDKAEITRWKVYL